MFSKSAPLSAQLPKPNQDQAPKQPRTKEQINEEYGKLCTTLGDKIVKKEGLEMEIKALFKHVENLGNELTAREELDKALSSKAAQEAANTVTAPKSDLVTDTLAPQTNGVDA